jgi:hypothetical protein
VSLSIAHDQLLRPAFLADFETRNWAVGAGQSPTDGQITQLTGCAWHARALDPCA